MQEAWTVSLQSDQRDDRTDEVIVLADIADELAASTEQYERYGYNLTNAERSEYACKALGLEPEDFSVLLPLPFDEWMVADDLALIRTGLFVLDMRLDAIKAARGQLHLTLEWMFEEQAEAEFYIRQFVAIAVRRERGVLLPDNRNLT